MSSLPVDWCLPADWKMKPLGEVATLQRGFDLPVQDRLDGHVKIYAANGPVGTHNEPKVRGPGVVTGRSGSIGKVHYVADDYWPLNTALWVKDFHGNDPRWVSRLLTWMQLEQFTRGVGVPTLNRNLVHEVKIPLPPLEEQKRIAGILDQADALRRLRTRALDKLNTLGQAIFHEMFGKSGITNSKTVQLGDLASRITKGESPKWQGHEYQDDGSLFVTSENVGWGELIFKKRKFVPLEFHEKLARSQLTDGDLLINLVGASIGRACLFSGWEKEANINQAVAVISLNDTVESLRNYILAYVLSDSGQNYLLGSRVDGARANVSLKDIKELPVYLPTKNELEVYSSRTSQVGCQRSDLEASLFKSETLFASLQHRAFRGEL